MTRSELIARLKEATRPSRELDAEIYCALNPGWAVNSAGRPAKRGFIANPAAWTSSIDAAAALIKERLDTKWGGIELFIARERGCRAIIWLTNPGFTAYHAHPAIALLIALLEAEEENDRSL